MTKEEIAKIPIPKLHELCQGDFNFFLDVVSYLVNMGINIGQQRNNRASNKAFKRFTEISSKN